MPHHQDQIASTLQRCIAKVLERHLADPRIRGLVSVTKVTVSPDRRAATVFVSVLPQQYEPRTLGGLNAAAGYIQGKVAKMVRTRQLPALRFVLDSSIKKQAEVFEAIRDGLEPPEEAQEKDS